MLQATKEVFNAGGVVGGSSAGTSCHVTFILNLIIYSNFNSN